MLAQDKNWSSVSSDAMGCVPSEFNWRFAMIDLDEAVDILELVLDGPRGECGINLTLTLLLKITLGGTPGDGCSEYLCS